MKSIKALFGEGIRDFSAFGGAVFYGVVSLFFLLYGEHLVFWFLLLGFVISLSTVIVIRSVWFKERPKKIKHSDWIGKISASSFPSMHAMMSTFLALLLIYYFWSYPVGVLITAVWLGVVFSRRFLGKHYYSDLIVGAVLGAALYYGLMWVF